MLDAKKLKEDFPIFNGNEELVYLDNAATSQKPVKVLDAVRDYYENDNSNVGRGLYDLANNATKDYRESRRKVANFINASSDEIVFVRNTTEAFNLLADSLEVDGKIVVPEMAHHSEQLPWRRKAEREDLEVDFIPTEDYHVDVEAAKEIIDEDTALVSVSMVSNVFGTGNDVETIIELAHENDALAVVDAAQAAPRERIDVGELDADFLAFSGHKMLAPSIGVLYGKKELLREMEPYQVGGGMISKVTDEEIVYTDTPEKFEAGTPDVAGAVGLRAAIEYLEDIGMKDIRRHEKELSKKMVEGLREIEGVEVFAPEHGEVSVVSFTTDFAHPHDVAEVLNQENIAVRAGHHCAQPQMEKLDLNGTTRASPYIYNTVRDSEILVEAVKKVKEVFD
ncbi:MAG: aminotransferase class V-fold PLP-dependent enzyme [Candidatus Nanohaloarchaea archaeon]